MVLLFNLVLPRKRGFTAFFTASWCWILFKAVSPFPGGCNGLCSLFLVWWACTESNRSLVGYEPTALPFEPQARIASTWRVVSRSSLANDILGASRSGWQRQPGLNRRIRGPKSRALPLGDVSIEEGRRSTTALGCFYIMVDQLNAAPFLQHIGCAFLPTPSGFATHSC